VGDKSAERSRVMCCKVVMGSPNRVIQWTSEVPWSFQMTFDNNIGEKIREKRLTFSSNSGGTINNPVRER
jgi:uncharacterized membrane protein